MSKLVVMELIRFWKAICLAVVVSAPQVIWAQAGCTDPRATNYDPGATINDGSCVYPATHYDPVLRSLLPSNISESSGLVWANGKLWTHNDSGGPAKIYSIDTTDGHVLQTVYIDNYPNVDWEDITADSAYLYVGDFGNNNSTRRDLKVLKIAKSDITSDTAVHLNAQAINFSYSDQTSFVSTTIHNFDCETMISVADTLYVFTKNWADLQTKVYKMPMAPGTYIVSPYTSYNVNGLITGASYDAASREIVLVGYFGYYGVNNAFLMFLNDYSGDSFFSGNKRRIDISNGLQWQTEGVAFITPKRFFLSCETKGTLPAALYISSESWLAGTTALEPIQTSVPRFYPNPAINVLHIDNIKDNVEYAIFNIMGAKVGRGMLNPGNNSIDISRLSNGVYSVECISSEGVCAKGKVEIMR